MSSGLAGPKAIAKIQTRELLLALLATVMFFPVGVFALASEIHAIRQRDAGAFSAARQSSRKTRRLSMLAIATGAAVILIAFAAMLGIKSIGQ